MIESMFEVEMPHYHAMDLHPKGRVSACWEPHRFTTTVKQEFTYEICGRCGMVRISDPPRT